MLDVILNAMAFVGLIFVFIPCCLLCLYSIVKMMITLSKDVYNWMKTEYEKYGDDEDE